MTDTNQHDRNAAAIHMFGLTCHDKTVTEWVNTGVMQERDLTSSGIAKMHEAQDLARAFAEHRRDVAARSDAIHAETYGKRIDELLQSNNDYQAEARAARWTLIEREATLRTIEHEWSIQRQSRHVALDELKGALARSEAALEEARREVSLLNQQAVDLTKRWEEGRRAATPPVGPTYERPVVDLVNALRQIEGPMRNAAKPTGGSLVLHKQDAQRIIAALDGIDDARYGVVPAAVYPGLTFAELTRESVLRCDESFAQPSDAGVDLSKQATTGDGRVLARVSHLASWSALEWAAALAGEVGELCNLLKKLRRRGPNATPTPEERSAIGKELADCQCYLPLVAARLGLDLADETIAKFNEVSERVGSPRRLGSPVTDHAHNTGAKP